MPTIDQLAPAAAASDADVLVISQNGVSRKIARGLLLAGLQQQIALPAGSLFGNPAQATGAPAQISIGANLTLAGGTLSAQATPYIVTALPSGTVPAAADVVPLGQASGNTAVTYSEFMAGLSALANIDGSKLTVQPTGATSPVKLADLASNTVLTTGATMSGALTLAGSPTQPLHAAPKQYVDARLQRSGDTMSGALTLPADPTQSLQAATKQYVDSRVQRSGDIMSGPLALAADPTLSLHAATKQYVDSRVQRSGDTMGGALTLAADPAQPLHAATKQYVDAQAANKLSTSGGTVSGAITMTSSGPNKVQNGSLYVGNSDFQHSVLNSSGPQTALFNKVGSATTDTSVVQSYYLVNHAGGTGHVINNLAIGTTIASTPADGVWGLLSSLTASSGGGNGGSTGHVGGYFQTIRAAVPIPSSTITSTATGTAVHVANISNFQTGYSAGTGYPISATNPLSVLINGNPYSVIACTPDVAGAVSGPGTLTLSSTITPADGVAGKPIVGVVNGSNLWGGVVEYHEQVDLPSSKSGYGQTLELDWVGNNVDDADSRCFISAVVGKNTVSGSDVEVGNVVGVWPGSGATKTTGASIKRGLQVNVPFSQAIVDGRNATQRSGANAIWFADGQTLAFSTDGKWAMRYNPSRPGIEFLLNGGVLGWVDTMSRYNAPGGFVAGGSIVAGGSLGAGQAGFDTRTAVQAAGANVVWLADGQRIAFSTDGSHTISYDSATASIVMGGSLRLAAPLTLPGYTVSTLPPSSTPGSKAYASDGRKAGEASGGGTGVEVFADKSGRWISVLSGLPVQA